MKLFTLMKCWSLEKGLAWDELVTFPNQHHGDHSAVGSMGQRKALREPQLCWNLSFPWASEPVNSGKNMVLVSPAPTASYYSDEYKKCGKFISTLKPAKEWFNTTLSGERSLCILFPKLGKASTEHFKKKKKVTISILKMVVQQLCTYGSFGIYFIETKELFTFLLSLSPPWLLSRR